MIERERQREIVRVYKVYKNIGYLNTIICNKISHVDHCEYNIIITIFLKCMVCGNCSNDLHVPLY